MCYATITHAHVNMSIDNIFQDFKAFKRFIVIKAINNNNNK